MRYRILALAFGLVGAGGCLEAERVITVNADGSGAVVDTIRPSGPMAAMIAMGQDAAAREQEKVTKEPRFTAAATAMGPGVRFESYEPTTGGKPEVIRYTFSDISKVKAELLPFFGNEKEEAVSETPLSFRFSRSGGTAVLTVLTPPEKPDPGAKKKTKEELDKEVAQIRAMAGQLKGLKMSSRLQIAETIRKSNAAYVERGTITLLEIDFDTLVSDEGSVRRLATLEEPTKADPRLLAGIKGLKVNALPTLTVEFGGR